MKKTTYTEQKVGNDADISDYFGNFDFSKYKDPKDAFKKMEEARKRIANPNISITKKSILTTDNVLKTLTIETEKPVSDKPSPSQTSQTKAHFFQPTPPSKVSTISNNTQTSSPAKGNGNFVSELNLQGSCRPVVHSRIGQVTLPPGMVLSHEMQQLIASHQKTMEARTVRKVVITNPSDAELIAEIEKLVAETIKDDRYKADRDVIELTEEIQSIIGEYNSSGLLSAENRTDLSNKKRDLIAVCEYIDEQSCSFK